MDSYMTAREIAKLLRCSEKWIRQLETEGKIRGRRKERSTLFQLESIRAYLRDRKKPIEDALERLENSKGGDNG